MTHHDVGPDEETVAGWDRHFAKSLFNSMIDKPDRTADEDIEMLLSATASRWHWGQVGGPEQVATGDWQVGHVAILGAGELALTFAHRGLTIAIEQEWDGWRLAWAHEGVARACAAAGDSVGRERH